MRALLVLAAAVMLAGCESDDDAPQPESTPRAAATATATPTPSPAAQRAQRVRLREYRVFAGARPHDVAPAPNGTVWFTAQGAGEMGRLDPRTGKTRRVKLPGGSAPHGVIIGPDDAAWITDGGLNAIVRVDDKTHRVRTFPLPASHPAANLNTATFDRRGRLWFTGQAGVYGRLDPTTGRMRVWDAPQGPGPYGISTTPSGRVWYSSLAGSHIARVSSDGSVKTVAPPTAGPAPAASGRTRAGGCGSANGTPGRSACTTRGATAGESGRCPAPIR